VTGIKRIIKDILLYWMIWLIQRTEGKNGMFPSSFLRPIDHDLTSSSLKVSFPQIHSSYEPTTILILTTYNAVVGAASSILNPFAQ